MTVNVNGGSHWVAVDEAKSLATGQVYIMDSLGGAQNTDLTLASRYASFNAIHAYTGGSTPSGGTVTPDPDPGLSVKETITCKRTIKLPERVVNLYSNPTDTTRLTYFDYGPTVYSSRYAVMSDGSIMYEVGANHQGQDIKAWLKYESDMTVTKEHTYGSTQYESAHPHRGYKTCQCGDKFYTGETTARSDCSECNANVKYAVDGGYITFDRKTGTITDCDSMVTKANIPQKIEGVAVKSIGANAFNNQQHLESVTIPDGVTSIGERAFCSSGVLTSVKIPDSVTSIGAYAFDTCSSLTNVTIPNGVTSIEEHTFDSCISLTSVTIPDSVTSIGGSAFRYCKSLTSVTIPGSVTSIGDRAFCICESLTSVTIPDSVTSIGSSAFYGCESLTSVTIPDSVTSIGEYAFYDCTSLTSVTIPDSVTSIGNCAFWKCSSLASVTIPDSVTSIGEYAFSDCKSLTSVTIPDSVTSISNYTFDSCTSLTSVTIPDSVTSIGEFAFRYCKSLTSVAIPNSVTSIGERAFSECTSLTSVTIPDSVTSIGVGAFASCTSLTGIWVAEGNSHYSSDASGVLFSKDKTTLVQCPGTLAACMIPDSVTSIVGYAFAGCTSLTNVTIPDSVTSIGSHAFSYCKSLTSVTIPNGVTSIHYGAFSNCKSLTSVAIPDSVTSIGESAFGACISLTSVTIPDGVTSIGYNAFGSCESLTDVYYAGSEAQWKAISISSTGNDDLLNANIHYNYVSHTHSYKDVVTAPTCTAKGYTTHTCSCGDSYVDTYVDALGHAWDNGKVTKEPTETETGVKTFTCTRCNETKTESIPVVSVDVTEMFSDVTKNWAYPGIQYCVTHKLMGSTGGDKFAPTMTTTRAQIVQILYNLEGEPEVSGTTPFTDLTQDWYQDAVLWAYQTGVVAGTGDGTTFDPDLPVTREQIAVILMEYTDRILNIKRTWTPADLSTFPDAGSVSDWAKDAMADAVALGLISGASNGGQTYLNPQGSATREQVATILMEFCKNVKK